MINLAGISVNVGALMILGLVVIAALVAWRYAMS